jgi:hypothetical protein
MYSLLLAVGGMMAALLLVPATGVLPAALLLAGSAFVALILGITSRSTGLGLAAMVIAAALLFAGTVAGIPFASDQTSAPPSERTAAEGPTPARTDSESPAYGTRPTPTKASGLPRRPARNAPPRSHEAREAQGESAGELFPDVPFEDRGR